MSDSDVPDRRLRVAGCRSECAWSASGGTLGGERLFACAGCGSEWVAGQAWTPVDWQGGIPDAVRAERAERGRPAGRAGQAERPERAARRSGT